MKDLRERLAAAGVHTLQAQFTDIHGVAKGKHLPLAHLDDLLTDGISFTGRSIAGTGLPRTGPRSEYVARGNASTTQLLPWMPGYARVVCDGFVGGEPFDACPRQVLRRAVARLAQHGWHLRTGIQPEFFLLKRINGHWEPADVGDRLEKPSYDLKALPRQADFLHALQRSLEACKLDVLQLDHEDAQSQYELDFGFDEALASADHLMLFKQAAHALAEARGMVFSLMPKPFANQPGSGMHFHVSLWKGQRDNAINVFVPHVPDGGVDLKTLLSPTGRQFVAGVLAHSAALCAICAPTVNSYKRRVVGEPPLGTNWASPYVAHGGNNRTAVVRTLHDRFEWRLPDASANPYLVSAVLIAAGLDGIDRRLELPPACDDDLFELPRAELERRGIGILPQDLDHALDALEADAVVCEALGPTLVEQFVQLKRAEHADYSRHVSDWELERYASAF
jgi:glutamine synthetase